MTGGDPVLRLTRVGRRFGDRDALHDVDVTITAGERIGVLGASGAGKSTLLAVMGGSLIATSGSVSIAGSDPATLGAAGLRRLQRRIGSVAQRLDLIDQVRVLHNVDAGRLGDRSLIRAALALAWPRADAEIGSALERVGLSGSAQRRTESLSGGERQRVAIARLLVQRPDLVLADEPVSSLDPVRADEVLRLLQEPCRTPSESPTTLVVSLHQPDLARRHCSRVLGLRAGRLVFDRPASQLDQRALDDLYAAA